MPAGRRPGRGTQSKQTVACHATMRVSVEAVVEDENEEEEFVRKDTSPLTNPHAASCLFFVFCDYIPSLGIFFPSK